MKYLNQFHKETAERKMKKVEDWLKNPISSAEASKQQFEMHKEIEKAYPKQSNTTQQREREQQDKEIEKKE